MKEVEKLLEDKDGMIIIETGCNENNPNSQGHDDFKITQNNYMPLIEKE